MAAEPKRKRRERGSITPEAILDGAFELAEDVSIEKFSMPMLGKRLGVGVTSIYWYFRKKDELLDAMADRAIERYTVESDAAADSAASAWRDEVARAAGRLREVYWTNPVLCDLILLRESAVRGSSVPAAGEVSRTIGALVDRGLSAETAHTISSAVRRHVEGTAVLERIHGRSENTDDATFELVLESILHRVESLIESPPAA